MKQTAMKSMILAGLLASGAAMAEDAPYTLSSNVSLVSDYLYRGITQTGSNPAIQGGFDYSHKSGAYAGIWASSISWLSDGGYAANAGTEIDTYFGYKGAAGDVGYDVGFLRYNYPGDVNPGFVSANTNEVYVAASYSIVTAKLSYSLGDLFATDDAKGSTYIEVNASYAPAEGVTLGAHVGKQTIKNSTDYNYTDFKVSASKDFSGYVLGLAYSKTTVDEDFWGDELGDSAFVFSLSRAF
jgi:uncharacterized protein (TIGR02001 family)